MIDRDEHLLLSAYSKAELIGGMILGNFVRKTKDDELRGALTKHAAEEFNHALYVVEALEELGLEPLEVHDDSKDQYYAQAGLPKDEVELMAMTAAFEPIVIHHYNAHIQAKGTNPVVAKALQKMNDEDDEHKDWIVVWLNNYPDQKYAQSTLKRYQEVIKVAYEKELKRLEKAGGRLADIAKKSRELMANESRA